LYCSPIKIETPEASVSGVFNLGPAFTASLLCSFLTLSFCRIAITLHWMRRILMMSGRYRRVVACAVLILSFVLFASVHIAAQWAPPSPSSASSIPASQLIQAEELSHLLHTRGLDKPLILQVGSRVMFAQAHIPGSEYAGAASQDAGSQQLRNRVAQLPRKTFIVLYCGCCPWNRCPNVGPAYSLLTGMGFTRVKVLYLANNFGADWVNKGYPVASGQ
jgi:thiosulfate/3-mercaptopyruvate sulfurtransferase